ncbi:F-box/FBD/LRR-repeat protein At1g13570 [Linum grandiflorum]
MNSTSSNPSSTQLPANVIGLILTFLPIKEAVRTSILSTQWRHRWRMIPQLVFDCDFATIDPGLENQDKLVMLDVFQTLMGHQGSSINKFKLAIPGMTSCSQVDPLIRQLSTKHVRELSLLLSPTVTNPSTKLELSSLLSLPDLITLKLQSFDLVTSHWSVRFSKLTVLELNNVILRSYFYQYLLPVMFPVLEELRVVDRIWSNNKRPVFSAPSLKVLFFHSHIQSICFEHTPRLSVLSILDTVQYNYSKSVGLYAKNNPDMVAVFAALPALEKLTIGLEFLLFLSQHDVPYQLPATLDNLKILEAPRISLGRSPEAQVLLCLIRSSPNLQKLTIVHDDDDDDDRHHPDSKQIDSLQKPLEPQDGCFQRLEEFNIKNSRGTQVEMDLVRFVLATAPKLKRVFIKPKEKLESDTMLEFVVEVLHYEKISKESFELLQPHRSVRFSKLTVLDLNNVMVPFEFYNVSLAAFPLLEELRVVDRFIKPSGSKRPVFSAPSLKVLFFDSPIQSICFKCTARLSVMSILHSVTYNYSKSYSFFAQNNPDIVAVFAALPALENLTIGFEFLLFLSEGDVPYQLPATLHNLKVLEAPRISLGRSPEVQHDDDKYHPDSKHIDSLQKLLEPEGHLGRVCCLQRLEEFDIKPSRGTRVEMELVKFVLATASKLKRVFVKSKEKLDPDTMVEFVVEVSRYEKISKNVEFIYVPSKKVISLYG